eukprot:1342142-Karenia_brevis.AAC.1
MVWPKSLGFGIRGHMVTKGANSGNGVAKDSWRTVGMVWPKSLGLANWATWSLQELTVGMVWPKSLELASWAT